MVEKTYINNNLSEKEETDELVNDLSKIEIKDILKVFVNHLQKDHKLSTDKIKDLFGKSVRKDLLPISIFNNNELSCLETIVKFLREEFGLRYHEIAVLINRNDRTIWATYNVACKKRKEKLVAKESKIFIPVSILKDRKYSVLESVVGYLK